MKVLLVGSVLSLQAPGVPLLESFILEKQTRTTVQFKSDVNAVHLDLAVTGPSHFYLPTLTLDDFEVFEDGLLQEVTFFSSDDAVPLTLVLLLDASSSIRSSLSEIKKAAAQLVGDMTPLDKAAVVVFSETIVRSTHFTAWQDPLLEAIRSMYPAGSTALYDAILHSLDKLSMVKGRKALLVFTDGSDSRPMPGGSKASAEEVIQAGKLSEATIYTVGFTADGRRVNEDVLTRLAGETGGRAFFPANVDHLNRSFVAIEEELHTSYRIAYTSKNDVLDGTWRSIEVRIHEQPDLVVRTRKGYYAVPSAIDSRSQFAAATPGRYP